MKLGEWIQDNTKKLERAGIATARLDCLVLLEDALGKDKSWILAHQEETVQGSTLYSLGEQIARRAGHEPLAYIRGTSEFCGRDFAVNNHTLEPRPETETMIELLQELVESKRLKVESLKAPSDGAITKNQQQKTRQDSSIMTILTDRDDSSAMTIVDVGTGSGCIAITAKLLYPQALVVATDIDKKCLAIAQKNSKRHNAEVVFHEGSLLEPLLNADYQAPDIILANLPYVPDGHTINQAAMHEPRHAIFGGKDGLDLYKDMFNQSQTLLSAPARWILTESLPSQHKDMERIASNHAYTLHATEDFIQVFRFKH